MRRIILLLFFVVNSIFTIKAQYKTCMQDGSTLEVLNSISKCAIKKVNNSLEEKSSTKNLRFLKRRNTIRKKKATSNTIYHSSNILETKSTTINNVKEEIILVSDLFKEKVLKENNVIDFSIVQNIPQFYSCRNSIDSNNCFNTEMSKHIKKFFNYPEKAIKNNLQGNILVQFTIDDEGSIKTIQVSGPKNSEILKKEARRVINKLSQFIPATHNGKKVFVRYSIPINFSL